MEQRKYGNTDLTVSVLGFGGAEIGFRGASVADVERLLGSALDAGLNVIDTAACYATSEELIGRAVGHRRSEYYLFTKCGHASGLPTPDWHPKTITASIDRSLQRLGTDYVDVIHLHSCSLEVLQRGDVIEALQKARDAGKTRYIGYSGDGQAALYAVESGVFDSVETSVNIADQEAIELTLPKARERGMGVVVKRPIANAAWLHSSLPENTYIQPYWRRLQALDYDLTKRGARDSVAAALRFTLTVPGVHTAIVGTSNPNRYLENAAMVAEGPLPEDEYEAIRRRWKEVAQVDWVGLE
ncbi:MAG: aldo/keto reductase [Alicyclobacillus herbarius]|uniref:aldo/keto reductase n=1 Tax=Alicyclobacillus herbarius TaxID=122960 RepID=UPI0023538477|nr:aldo/keto reductase [Alicyclobacillus herbarius]MCL6632376.1 aldo/keto reductase [Alicyclobacillus herbarius]